LDGVLKQGMEVHVELKLSELEKGEKIGKGATGDVLSGKLKIGNHFEFILNYQCRFLKKLPCFNKSAFFG